MANHATHIRRIYGRPRQRGAAADPGKVSTCIQVGVRPKTTLIAHETMLGALAETAAGRASLAGVRRLDVLDRDAGRLGLVADEGLQLAKRPAVEPGTHSLTGFYPVADMCQILHHDLTHTQTYGFLDDRLARFVIDVLYAPHLLAGDLPEPVLSALAAVGLKTPTKGKVFVALVAQPLAAEDLARACRGEIIFPDIHAHHWAGCHLLHVSGLDDKVKEPPALSKDELGFFRSAGCKNATLMFAGTQAHGNAALERVERNRVAFKRIRALVKMHARTVKLDRWYLGILPDSPQFFLRLERLTDGENGIAAHLATQRRCPAQVVVGAPVQTDAVPQPMLAYRRHQTIAGTRVGGAQGRQRRRLLRRYEQCDRGRTQHRLSPIGDELAALDVATNRLGADIACPADRRRRGPRLAIGKLPLKLREALEQKIYRDALEHLDDIGHGDCEQEANKQVDMVRRDLLCDVQPTPLRASCIPRRNRFLCLPAPQNVP